MASPGLCSTLTLWWKLSLSYIIITINEVRIASHPAFLEDFPAQLSLGEAAHVQRPPHRPGPEVGVSHESNLWSTLQGGREAGQLRIAGQLNGSIWYLAIKHGITWWKTGMEESWDYQQSTVRDVEDSSMNGLVIYLARIYPSTRLLYLIRSYPIYTCMVCIYYIYIL